ncbi:MAG: hypothetical protein CEN91_55 [Candidatus Berkelbacteria bacterium Licking1014_85]|uniref:DUF8128 domain-containing protein n=1 Tax=Candidatus Berkelbacteria bacterium Licking1014_85 TaxID=2017148 RepID=A0A554LMX0_9BACT|nr:MAG: hypothetical protein CEN91_55 [Candidatus Berkelbacteria bacterium Licking1014_85]
MTVAAEIGLSKEEIYPIKTFQNFDVDPLASITSMLSKINTGEEIWVQIIIQPENDEWHKKGIKYVAAMKETGKPPQSIAISKELQKKFTDFSKEVAQSAGNLFKPTIESSDSKKSDEGIKLPGTTETALGGIEQKITKLGFKTTIRIVAIADDEEKAKSKIQGILGAFMQFNTINLNSFKLQEMKTSSEALYDFIDRKPSSSSYILNIEEIASIYHLPNITVETPLIGWAGSKKGEPPSNLPVMSQENTEELTVIGETNFRNYKMQFGIKKRDRRLHIYSIGKTGTGKSTLLENMIIDDIKSGRGVAVVDPHGDLIDRVLDFVGDDRINDVVYFSPADREYPIGFNVLENVDPDLKSIVASGVVGIFKKIFGESWGPRLEYILRNTVLALLDYPNSTMLGITKMLIDKNYRKKVVSYITDPVILDFWVNEFEKYDQKFRTEAVAPIQNKVGQFLSSATIRNIVGQSKSTINLNDIMDNKKILLIDLSMGKIGEDMAALLGAMMITKIQLAAMQRASIPEPDRIDFYLYVDEFQNFATDSFATILSEARKYHLNLTMTNQYIAQMPDVVREAVFGNVGTLISFRVGAGDSSALTKEFEPVFEANDLVNLSNYHIYIKMAIDGVSCPAFSAVTLVPRDDKSHNREEIIKHSREFYAKNREEVESELVRQNDNPINYNSLSASNTEEGPVKIDKFHYQDQDQIYFTNKKGEKWYILDNSKINPPTGGQNSKIDNNNDSIQPIEEI